MNRRAILVVPPPSLYRKLFNEAAHARLLALGDIAFNPMEKDWTTDQLADRIADVDVLVTSWRTPKLTDALLDRATKLKLVAHSAGSVKFMLDETIFARGIEVTSAGAAMIQPVAETTVLLAMMMLRPIYKLDAGLRNGLSWPELKAAGIGDEISTQTVGVVGAGQIGRRVIQMLRAWDIPTIVYDPMLSADRARGMGVRQAASLEELMSASRLVTLHAPVLPETHHLIDRKQLSLLRDGGIVINTARAWLVDNDALADELKAGRLRAALDVHDIEPLPLDSPWRSMPNCLVLPHVASNTPQCFHRQGDYTVDEVERFVTGEPLKYGIDAALLATMA